MYFYSECSLLGLNLFYFVLFEGWCQNDPKVFYSCIYRARRVADHFKICSIIIVCYILIYIINTYILSIFSVICFKARERTNKDCCCCNLCCLQVCQYKSGTMPLEWKMMYQNLMLTKNFTLRMWRKRSGMQLSINFIGHKITI